MPGAREALLSLKEAGHILILYSARVNGWLIRDPELDPLALAGVRKVRNRDLTVNKARYRQMLDFVHDELEGVFDLVWEHQGKPSADIFIDDRGLQYGFGVGNTWRVIMERYGER